MPKYIQDATILNVEGKALKAPERDDDGNVLWENAEKTEPRLKDTSASDILRIVVLNIPQPLQLPNDSMRVAQLFQVIEPVDGKLVLKDKVYEWLHRLFKREMPLTKTEDAKTATYASLLWGINWRGVVEQLKDVDERKSIEDWDDEE